MEDRLRRLSLRDTALISVGLAVFYYFFIYNSPDLATRTASARSEIRSITAENSLMVETIERGPKLEEEIASIKAEIRERSSRFKMSLAPERVQQIISEEARAAGIFFESITDARTGGGSSSSGYSNRTRQRTASAPEWFSIDNYLNKFEISTSFNGTYAQVMRFLSYLTRTDDIVTLKQLTVTAGQLSAADMTSGKSPALRFDATFEAYTLLSDVLADSLKPEEGTQ